VSRKRKTVVGLAGLALAGGACLGGIAAAPVAGAASLTCGSSCVSLYNQKFGSEDVSAVSGGTAAMGQAVILSAATTTRTEDWSAAFQGAVSDFYAAGLMNATLDAHYGTDPVYEFQYKPGGTSSGECLGIASGPGQGTKVTLQPCGKTASTAWIYDTADASGGYVPYISGSDTKWPAPYVLTAPNVEGDFTTQALFNLFGIVASDQMWQLISGVLPVRNQHWTGHVLDSDGAATPPDMLHSTATFTVPKIVCNWSAFLSDAAALYWVGLGSFGEPLAQVGIETDCGLRAFQPSQASWGWWEIANNITEQPLSTTRYPVQPGDVITAETDYTGDGVAADYIFTLTDHRNGTQVWNWGTTCPGNAACPAGLATGYPQYAETAVEAPVNSFGQARALADFGTVQFTNVQYTRKNGGNYPVLSFEAPSSGEPEAVVTGASANFAVTWERNN